jgi:hypothetical protein
MQHGTHETGQNTRSPRTIDTHPILFTCLGLGLVNTPSKSPYTISYPMTTSSTPGVLSGSIIFSPTRGCEYKALTIVLYVYKGCTKKTWHWMGTATIKSGTTFTDDMSNGYKVLQTHTPVQTEGRGTFDSAVEHLTYTFGNQVRMQVLGSGRYGRAYLCEFQGGLGEFVNVMVGLSEDTSNMVLNPDLQNTNSMSAKRCKGNLFVIKLALIDTSDVSSDTEHRMAVSENLAHLAMNRAEITHIGEDTLVEPLSGIDYSPIFGAGMTLVRHTLWSGGGFRKSFAYRCTAMEYFDGISLEVFVHQYVRKGEMDTRVYAMLEVGTLLLWQAGLIHADLHANNVLVATDRSRLAIIDFGQAVHVESQLQGRAAQALRKFSGDANPDFLNRVFAQVYYKKAKHTMDVRRFASVLLDTELMRSMRKPMDDHIKSRGTRAYAALRELKRARQEIIGQVLPVGY